MKLWPLKLHKHGAFCIVSLCFYSVNLNTVYYSGSFCQDVDDFLILMPRVIAAPFKRSVFRQISILYKDPSSHQRSLPLAFVSGTSQRRHKDSFVFEECSLSFWGVSVPAFHGPSATGLNLETKQLITFDGLEQRQQRSCRAENQRRKEEQAAKKHVRGTRPSSSALSISSPHMLLLIQTE